MKRTLTPEQTEARDARRAKFKELWKQVSAMTLEERVKMAMRLGITTCDGHPLSTANSILCMLQIPGVSIVGGFRQWLKHGRCVMKGQKAAQIWAPCGNRKSTDAPLEANAAPTGENDRRFITGNVFDISSTCLLDEGTEGQDRENYTDTQDRESYVPDVKLLPTPAEDEPYAPQIITPPGTIDGKFELLND